MPSNEVKINSLRVRFERGNREPSEAEIFIFMKEKMQLDHTKLLCMYKENAELSVIIKFKTDNDLMEILCKLPGSMEFTYNDGQSCKVQLSAAKEVVRYVRLFNLPPEIEDQEIWAVMSKYGKIQRMIRERYASDTGFPIWTSVRGVYMELNEGHEIPAFVHVRNLRARIYYEGLLNKCFQCGSTDHLKANCPQRTNLNERLQVNQNRSYSEAASGRWTKPAASNTIIKETAENMTNLNMLFPSTHATRREQSGIVGGSSRTLTVDTNVHKPNIKLGIETCKVGALSTLDSCQLSSAQKEQSLKRGRSSDKTKDNVADIDQSESDESTISSEQIHTIVEDKDLTTFSEAQGTLTRSKTRCKTKQPKLIRVENSNKEAKEFITEKN